MRILQLNFLLPLFFDPFSTPSSHFIVKVSLERVGMIDLMVYFILKVSHEMVAMIDLMVYFI